MKNINNSVEVLINDRPQKIYEHEGNHYIVAQEGSEFEIKLKNNLSQRRKLFVPSIDGLSVVNGQPASVDSPGYIVDAQSAFRVKGYRLDNDSVAKFKFSTKKNSYAANTVKDGGGNCGVIGVAIWKEQPKRDPLHSFFDDFYTTPYCPWTPRTLALYNPIWYSVSIKTSSSDNAQSLNNVTAKSLNTGPASDSQFSLGTSFGKKETSKVTNASFGRGVLEETISIYYDTKENLEKLGVVFNKVPEVSMPQAFPGFCKPPSGWVG